MMKSRPTKCIFKVNHIFRISMLLLHVSVLQEHHLQGAQSILMQLCVCYVISAEWVKVESGSPFVCCQPKESSDNTQTVIHSLPSLFRHLWLRKRTISSGYFGLPEDGTAACRSKIDIINIWFTLKMHFVGLSFIIMCYLAYLSAWVVRNHYYI
jgi:hypothetical protein